MTTRTAEAEHAAAVNEWRAAVKVAWQSAQGNAVLPIVRRFRLSPPETASAKVLHDAAAALRAAVGGER